MTRLFISYSNQDREFAEQIQRTLSQVGIMTTLDDAEESSGSDVKSTIRDAVRTADALLLVASDKALSNNSVMLEIGIARGLGKKVVAVAAPGAKPDINLLNSLADGYLPDAAKLEPRELGAQVEEVVEKTV